MTRLTLRLPDHLHSRLRAESEQSGRSLNQTIVVALRAALDDAPDTTVDSPLQEQLRRLRETLGDLVVELSADQFLEDLGASDTDMGEEPSRKILPLLDPPLSATVIQEREDRV